MLKIQTKLIISSCPEYDAFCLWNVNFDCITYFCQLAKTICRGTQREVLRKRPKNNNRAQIKLSEAIFSIFGDCWEQFICSSLPARLVEEFPASKVHLQTGFWQIAYSSYSRQQILSDTLHCLFPRITFLPRTYYFFQISQPAKIGL